MNFISLPTELIVQIFEYVSVNNVDQLYILENVCKLFMTIVHNYRWNSTITFSASSAAISRSFLKYKFKKLTINGDVENPLVWFMEATNIIITCYSKSTLDLINAVVNLSSKVLVQNNCRTIIVWLMDTSSVSTSVVYQNPNTVMANQHLYYILPCKTCAYYTNSIPDSNNKSIIMYNNNTDYFNNVADSMAKFIQCIYHYKNSMLRSDQHIIDRWLEIDKTKRRQPIMIKVYTRSYNILYYRDDGLYSLRFS